MTSKQLDLFTDILPVFDYETLYKKTYHITKSANILDHLTSHEGILPGDEFCISDMGRIDHYKMTECGAKILSSFDRETKTSIIRDKYWYPIIACYFVQDSSNE